MTTAAFKKLRKKVMNRAANYCECGCGRWIGGAHGDADAGGHLDHFFGRGAGRPEESLSNCWALSVTCDEAKTNNRGGAAHWLNRFIVHCEAHDYLPEVELAEARLECLRAKGLTE